MPSLGFNGMDQRDLQSINPGRQTNIFAYMAINKPNLPRLPADLPVQA